MFKHLTMSLLGLFMAMSVMAGSPNGSSTPADKEPKKSSVSTKEWLKTMHTALQQKAEQQALSKKEEKLMHLLDKKIQKQESRDARRVAKGKDAKGGKSWIAAFLLAFFFGLLGVHRFYLGYTWQGVVQLFTAGGLGIWWLIDFIRIITKDLKPKDGDYN